MSSKVQICNSGISRYLGAGRITSIDEDSTPAIQCKLHFDDIVRSSFEAHWWNFATGRQLLAELTNDRSNEWAYKYAVPADAVSIRWVNDASAARGLLADHRDPDTDRELVEETLYSNIPSATCEYTKLITDEALYPQYFADMLSAKIAAAIALPVTKDMTLARNAMEVAGMLMEDAIVLDQRNNAPKGQPLPQYLIDRGL